MKTVEPSDLMTHEPYLGRNERVLLGIGGIGNKS